MHKRENKVFSTTGNEYRLKEIFSVLKEQKRACYRDKTVIFSKYPVLFIMSKLLDFVQLPNNPYKMDNLINLFKQHDFNDKEPLFSLDDLFAEGWLISFIDEWSFNGFKNSINVVEETSDERINQIVDFLKGLTGFKYTDEWRLKVDINDKRFCDFLKELKIDLKDLTDIGILINNQSGYYVEPNSGIWAEWGSKVLTEKLNQWVSEGKKDAYTYWVDTYSYFHSSSMPEIDPNYINKLFDMCLAYLEKEHRTWRDISAIIEKYYQLDRNNLFKNYDIFIPENTRDRFNYLSSNDDLHMIFCVSLQHEQLFYLCVRNYRKVHKSLQQRFCALLKKPLYNIYYFHLGFQNEDCTIDCLCEKDLFYESAVSLWDYIMAASAKGIVSDKRLMEFVNELWQIIRIDLVFIEQGERSRDIVEFLLYILRDEERRKKNLQNRNLSYNIFDSIIELYDKDIPYGTDAEKSLFRDIVDLIERTNDYICTYYLYILFRLADSYKYDKSECGREIYGIVFDGFCKWFENAIKYDLGLSVIPNSFFEIDMWKHVFEKNYKKAEIFFDLYNKNKKSIMNAVKESKGIALINNGRLSIVYLYLSTIWLNELKCDFSEKEYLILEKKWINDFFELHEVFELFSAEHIRMLQSEFAISRCMKVVSGFTDNGIQFYEKKLKRINAGDLIFWLEYVEHINLKKQFIRILANKDEESLTNNIYSIPTEIQLSKKLGDICWEQYNQEINAIEVENKHIFIEMLKYVLADISSTIKEKPYLENDYKKWIDSMQNVVLILEGHEDEILNGDSDFYKGLVYLNSKKIDELRIAVELYEKYYLEGIDSGSVNYVIALSLLISRLYEEGNEYEEEIAVLEEASDNLLDNIQKLDAGNASELYYYLLFVYFQIDDKESFWGLVKVCPDKFVTNLDIAEIIIRRCARDKEIGKAQSLLKKLRKKYGENEIFNELERILGSDGSVISLSTPFRKQLVESSWVSFDVVPDIKSALRHIPQLRIDNMAKVFTDEDIEPQALELYKTEELDGFVVVHLLSLLFKSIKRLEEYRHFMMIEKKTREEDTYNATLTRFFNMIVPDCIGYEMVDQSQGGTTGNVHKNGEMGKGERDIIIKRSSREIMLLEGLKLKKFEKDTISKHISKIEGYNGSDMSIVAMPIYIDTLQVNELWGKYLQYLKELKKNEQCNLKEIFTEFDWKKVGLEEYPPMVCRTTHFYPERSLEVHIYHIFIRVGM